MVLKWSYILRHFFHTLKYLWEIVKKTCCKFKSSPMLWENERKIVISPYHFTPHFCANFSFCAPWNAYVWWWKVCSCMHNVNLFDFFGPFIHNIKNEKKRQLPTSGLESSRKVSVVTSYTHWIDVIVYCSRNDTLKHALFLASVHQPNHYTCMVT